MKVAIVHDWFVGGGAERVVEQLHKMYPKAPIYTSYCSPEWRERLKGAEITTSYMQHWPFSKLRKFLPPLRAIWFSRLDLSDYDLVISSSGAEAKAIKVSAPSVHINYCHAPTHYYWSRYEEYMKSPGFGKLDWLARIGLKLLLGPMRRWADKAAQRPTYMIANSNYTKEQIIKYYGRDSVVIHPPVDVLRFAGRAEEPRRGFVTAGRQTPYKRIDLAVQACTKLNLPLVVIGNGPDNRRLQRLAGKSITFLTGKTDEELTHYFQTSLAFIFPGLDDFGITAVEAMAAGTPVIAYKAGGALDYVQPGKTGEFFGEQTADSLSAALKKFSSDKFNHAQIQKAAAKYSPESFCSALEKFVQKSVR
ncbi:MAG TPA: glycosyltransferase [Candidatus Saccharimonadales bacterium]|nr:glycosyltransferase [Candidatus Saccharimonadales bacterium]